MFKTKQKSLILDVVSSSRSHPSAYEVYESCKTSIPNISLGTVYRNLNTLVEKGKIKALHMSDNTIRYDRMNDEHHHFICNRCNKIYDIHHKIDLEDLPDGHKVMDYELTIRGICKKCIEMEEV